MADVAYDPMGYAWRVLFVLAVLGAVAYWLRQRWRGEAPRRASHRRMRIVESLAVGPQRHVHLVAVGDQQYLIGVTPQAVTFLTSVHESPHSDEDGPNRMSVTDEQAMTGTEFESFLEEAEGGTPREAGTE